MKKILIVDDDKHITKALHRELKDWCAERKLSILTSNNPIDVPDMIKNDGEIFLLISDMMMPGMTGAQLSDSVKKINPHLIIFIMTGYSHIDLVVKAVSSGISSLIIKPWNLDLLIIELESSLEKQLLKEEEANHKKRIEEELKWGGELQKQLLKRDLPVNSKVSFSIHYEPLPSLFCGGDYYDVIPLPENRFFIICADVAGHGIKAAFITTILKSIIFSGYVSHHKNDLDPAAFLKWLNGQLLIELVSCPDIIITASVVLLDLTKSSIIYSNAGHTPLYIKHKNSIHQINLDGTALNFSQDVQFLENRISVEKEDIIYFFTDGLLEIGENNQMLESELTKKIILQSFLENMDARKLVELFKNSSESKAFDDDVTVLMVNIL